MLIRKGFLGPQWIFRSKRKAFFHLPGSLASAEWQWDGSDWSHTGSGLGSFLTLQAQNWEDYSPLQTHQGTLKSEIIVAKYISSTAVIYLLSQVSLCRHKGYTVSYSCHSTQNNTAGKNTSDKDRLLLPLNIRLGLFFSGMLKTFQRQHINF